MMNMLFIICIMQKCDDVNDDVLPPMFGKYNDEDLCHFDDYDDVVVVVSM